VRALRYWREPIPAPRWWFVGLLAVGYWIRGWLPPPSMDALLTGLIMIPVALVLCGAVVVLGLAVQLPLYAGLGALGRAGQWAIDRIARRGRGG
jgi:hypothetical protein